MPNPQSTICNEPTLQQRFHDLNVASSCEAAALAAQGEHATGWKLVFRPFFTFVRVYLRHGEWRRGVAGLITALFSSYAVFVRYAKLWEHRKLKPCPSSPPER